MGASIIIQNNYVTAVPVHEHIKSLNAFIDIEY